MGWGGTTIPLVTGLTPSSSNDFGFKMAVANGGLYFARGDTIYRVPLPNGVGAAQPPVFITVGMPRDAMADDRHLYWADYTSTGSITRCPLSGCGDAPEVLAPGQNRPTGLLQDETAIYWAAGPNVFRLAK